METGHSPSKAVHVGWWMYLRKDSTPELPRFDMVFGGTLRKDNRWVVLGDIIPWDEVETRYAELFSGSNGRPALPIRVALGSRLMEYDAPRISDRNRKVNKVLTAPS